MHEKALSDDNITNAGFRVAWEAELQHVLANHGTSSPDEQQFLVERRVWMRLCEMVSASDNVRS